jgi:ATP-dependent helicase/nuclease subunit A
LPKALKDSFIYKVDVRWIVDYKSSEEEAAQTMDEFIARETATYKNQLHRYRTLLSSMGVFP